MATKKAVSKKTAKKAPAKKTTTKKAVAKKTTAKTAKKNTQYKGDAYFWGGLAIALCAAGAFTVLALGIGSMISH